MVYFFGRDKLSVFFAAFAKGVLGYIPVAYAHPLRSVAFTRFRITHVSFITPCFLFCMLFAVPSVCQLRASRLRTWAFRFVWHLCLLKAKSLVELCPQGFLSFSHDTIIHYSSGKSVREITHYLPNNSSAKCWTARFFLLYADERSMLNRSQISYTASVLRSS